MYLLPKITLRLFRVYNADVIYYFVFPYAYSLSSMLNSYDTVHSCSLWIFSGRKKLMILVNHIIHDVWGGGIGTIKKTCLS